MMQQPPAFGTMMPMRPRPDPMGQGAQIMKLVREMQAKQPAAPAAPPVANAGGDNGSSPSPAPGGDMMQGLLPMLMGGKMPPMGLLSALFGGKGMGGLFGGGGAGAMPGNEVSLPDPISGLGGW